MNHSFLPHEMIKKQQRVQHLQNHSLLNFRAHTHTHTRSEPTEKQARHFTKEGINSRGAHKKKEEAEITPCMDK